ncbi:MAG: TonB family protein [Nostoc sp. CmiVER01]|uniref:TonB family protein n=1 Tax=Nostoc sp. CmiVER01 TaxID=3075384 RepID=UPI002AD2EAB1|nr:TonB family protein [Nostoc sp. CmiVER01]MDZ8126203.1 TonB family protein [Nostoc sp. CmiVER01]
MVDSDKFLYYRSVRSIDMLQGVIISILLHSILLIGSKYWYRALIREPKQEIAQETPIEVVEVPANKTDIPPKTSFRATKNSIAGGKALPKRPVSAMKSANPTEYKGYNNRSSDLTASSPAEVFQTRRQQKRELPNISRQQPQFKSQKTISASVSEAQLPNSKKIAVAPMARPLPVPLLKTAPNPKPIPSAHTTTVQTPDFKKIAVAPLFKTAPLTKPLAPSPKPIPSARTTTVQAPDSKKLAVAPLFKTVPLTKPLAPNPKQTASARTTTVQVPNSKKITVAPTTTPLLVTQGKTAIERATTLPVPSNPKKLGQSTTRLSARTPTQAQSSLKTGAASLLGGTVGISSQNYRGDDLAALPNSNRDRQATSGIDAHSQDVDLTAYLNQLKQRVRQQWLPGMSQSNRRTVLNFTINRSGQVSNLNIAQTSGFSVTDEVALNAIQRSAPFAPLPTEYPKNHLDIEFTFDINVYGELNLWRDGG